ncbi:hypothetical protein HanIR_Chr15g0751661 [Helianthus annuus]|nr:hypothetical protein HanIR_Chr15g0751661 [Helianthus annuus]
MERAKSKDGCAGVVQKGVPVYHRKYKHKACSEIYLRYFLNTFLRFSLLVVMLPDSLDNHFPSNSIYV